MEEYLQTANGQLGNRRVRCLLNVRYKRGGTEKGKIDTFTHNGLFTCFCMFLVLFLSSGLCAFYSSSVTNNKK